MKKIILTLAIALMAGLTFGQSKIGFVDYAALRDTLPQTDTLEQEIKDATNKYQYEIEESQKRMAELQNDLKTTLETKFKKYIESDIVKTQEEMQTKYQEANYVIETLQQNALFELNEIIDVAVKEVAKEKGYTIVLDSSAGVMVYGDPKEDLTKVVAAKLKIKI